MADVYEAYQQALQAEPEDEQVPGPPPSAPFTRTLVLQLPADWALVSQAEMIEALSAMRVESLVVLRPKSSHELASYEDALVQGARRDHMWDYSVTESNEREISVSAGACACVAALLQGGSVTALAADGVLADPDAVANAMGTGGLRSASFKALHPVNLESQQEPLSDAEALCYRTLASGLETCSSLEHLTLGHPALLALHDNIARFAAPGGPQLKSLGIHFYTPQIQRAAEGEAPSTEIQPFMAAVGALKTLTTFRADVMVTDRDTLKAVFIEPLRDHPSLTQVHFGRDDNFGIAEVTESNLLSLLELLRFALRCELTDLAWTMGRGSDELGDLLEDYRRQGGQMEFPATVREIRDILTNPKLVLRNFRIEGVHALSEMLEAFHEGLSINRSLRNVVIDKCPQSLESTVKAQQAFEQNPHLESMKLGYSFDDYYISLEDGSIHSVDYEYPDHGSFSALALRDDLHPDVIEEANQTFAKLQPHANSLFASLKYIAMQRRIERVLGSVVATMGTTTTTTTTTTTNTTTTATTGTQGATGSADNLVRTTTDSEQPQ